MDKSKANMNSNEKKNSQLIMKMNYSEMIKRNPMKLSLMVQQALLMKQKA